MNGGHRTKDRVPTCKTSLCVICSPDLDTEYPKLGKGDELVCSSLPFGIFLVVTVQSRTKSIFIK